MKILVLNCGSSSLKFQLIESETSERLIKGNFERIGGMKSTLRINVRGNKEQIAHIARDFDEAIEFVLEVLLKPEYNLIKSLDEIQAVGHRIVHGGEKFNKPVLINDKVIEAIEECIPLAPLHNPAGILGIEACKKEMPNTPMVAVFDTAFHQTIPEDRYIYPIPYRYYEKYGVRKYGFHGTSHEFVANRVAEMMGKNIEDLKVGARIEENSNKENPLDFTLWKETQEGIRWDSPWSKGRPGWHTECVTMISKLTPDTFVSIHGGGMDLKFPHHENEQAQAIAYCEHGLADIWMHNGMVNINNEKMS